MVGVYWSLEDDGGSSWGSSLGVAGKELSTVDTELIESFWVRVPALTGLGCSLRPSDPPSVGNPDTPSTVVPLLIRLGRPSIGLDATKVFEVRLV